MEAQPIDLLCGGVTTLRGNGGSMKQYMVKVAGRGSGLGYVEAADADSAASSLSVMEMPGFYLHIVNVPMDAPLSIDWQGLWNALPDNHSYAGVAKRVLRRIVVGPTQGNYLDGAARSLQIYISNRGPGSPAYEASDNADRAAYWIYWACHTDLRIQEMHNKYRDMLAEASRLGNDIIYTKARAFDRLTELEAYDRDGGWTDDEGETVPRSEVAAAWESAREAVTRLQERVATLKAEAQSLWDELQEGELKELAQSYEQAAKHYLAA